MTDPATTEIDPPRLALGDADAAYQAAVERARAEDWVNETLRYDSASGQYIYTWKTDKTWAGTCRQFSLRLADGSLDEWCNETMRRLEPHL